MIFSCDKALLQTAVGTASRATAPKSPIPALEGILLEAGEGNVKLTGYDLKKGIYTAIEADVSEAGAIVLGARIFGEIVRNLPNGDVTVKTTGKNNVLITCGNAEYSIIGSDFSDYPELPSIDEQGGVKLPQNILGEMIRQTIFAVSDNESRPVYTGELFEIGEGSLTVVAVDGYRLALRRERIQNETESTSFIVPGNALSDLEKLCADSDEPVNIRLGSKHISFAIGRTLLISRRLEGEFINYRKAVPTSFGVSVKTECSALQRAVERVSLIIDDKVKNPLHCTFKENSIHILCATALGKAEDICAVEGEGGGIEIGFNNRYLLDALKAAPADEVNVCLNNGSSPCVITPVDDGDAFLYMILPVRLKSVN